MSAWKPLDKVGFFIARRWTPRLQVRVGVLATLGGLLLVPYGILSGEPLIIYEMSAFALILGGLGVVVTAVLAVSEDDDSSASDLDAD